ncbi:unnamed protein product [Adineta steineri]|uniref:NACHT domain-containing protein n=1 Tax=Adineta steineri TaxID=433720 RepID=A0A813MSC2_9BILA|nr:unnamed protein product [Adineta steineri]CAF3767160.1 unnamed protein product [Adineta steineri]
MAQQITSTRKNDFVHSGISKLQDTTDSPIYGYQDLPDVTLEEAVENIEFDVPGVKAFASKAKNECYKRNTELTLDESAAIYLYTMPNSSFHTALNDRLRAENRDELVPWFAYLKLFINSLGKLPSLAITVWRGVASDISHDFFQDPVQTWWTVSSCSKDLNVIQGYIDVNAGAGTVFAIETLHGKDVSKYSAFGVAEKEVVLMPGTQPITKDQETIDFHNVPEPSAMQRKVRELIHRIEDQPATPQYTLSQLASGPNYLFELIKFGYKRNSRIERFMNPAKSFPIDQSYINLAIVETKEQQEKEKELRDSQHNDAIMEAFENIHGTKTPVDIEDIFKTCKDQTRNVLVFGRAGIGKSTFCQYIAYQWATGMIWQEYELIVLLPLRSLTADRYPILPAGTEYSLIHVMRKECFSSDQYLSEKDEEQLQEQFYKSRILWLFDGTSGFSWDGK